MHRTSRILVRFWPGKGKNARRTEKSLRWCRRRDLNSRPSLYESAALPLSYAGRVPSSGISSRRSPKWKRWRRRIYPEGPRIMGWQWSSCRSFRRLGQRCHKPMACAVAPREPSLLPVRSILVQMAGIEPSSAGWLSRILRTFHPTTDRWRGCIRTASVRVGPVLADTGSECSTIELHLRNCCAEVLMLRLNFGFGGRPRTLHPRFSNRMCCPELSLLLTPYHSSFPSPSGSADMVRSFLSQAPVGR